MHTSFPLRAYLSVSNPGVVCMWRRRALADLLRRKEFLSIHHRLGDKKKLGSRKENPNQSCRLEYGPSPS